MRGWGCQGPYLTNQGFSKVRLSCPLPGARSAEQALDVPKVATHRCVASNDRCNLEALAEWHGGHAALIDVSRAMTAATGLNKALWVFSLSG